MVCQWAFRPSGRNESFAPWTEILVIFEGARKGDDLWSPLEVTRVLAVMISLRNWTIHAGVEYRELYTHPFDEVY